MSAANRQEIPADEPFGGVLPPPQGPFTVVSEVHVYAGATESSGT